MESIIRLNFVILISLSSFFQETDLKPLFLLFPAFYYLIFILLKNVFPKPSFLVFEALVIIYFIYITGNISYLFFIFILAPLYIENKRYFLFYTLTLIIPVIFAIYIEQYIDYFFIITALSIYSAFLAIHIKLQNYRREIDILKSELVKLTSKVSFYFEKAKPCDLSKFDDINMKDEKKLLFKLFSLLKVTGIAFFDIQNQKCLTIGDGICNKDLLKYIDEKIYSFRFNDKFVVVMPVYKNDELSKVFFFFYDDNALIDNFNIFYYLKSKFENEILISLQSKCNVVESVN